MRHRSVILILLLLLVLGFALPGMGDDLFLVTVISVDRDRGTLVVRIDDASGPEGTLPLSGGDGAAPGADDPGFMVISDRILAGEALPGQILRVWGEIGPSRSAIVPTRNPGLQPAMGRQDPSGVRRRLRQSLRPPGGGMGGHGRP